MDPRSISLGFSVFAAWSSQCPDQAFDLISVGGGSGGLACAQRAAEYGAKAAVIESRPPGRHLRQCRLRPEESHVERGGRGLEPRPTPNDYGFDVTVGANDWRALKRKRDAYVLRLNGIYERNLAAKGVTYVRGAAPLPGRAHGGGERRALDGARTSSSPPAARPRCRALPGAELGITSDGFFELEKRPQRVAVVGSGYVACELAGAFRELGSEVELFVRKRPSAHRASMPCWANR